MQRKLMLLAAGILALVAAGCSSIVQKPEVEQVKKIAILSVYANAKVPDADGRGVVKNWDEAFKMQVAEEFLNIYKTGFNKLGWTVVNPDAVLASPEYKAAFEIKAADTRSVAVNSVLNMVANLAKDGNRRQFFTPVGMYPVQFQESNEYSSCSGNGCPAPPETALAKFARQLKVDAIAVVQIDYCYEGGTWTSLGGLGEAFMTAATSIKVVSKDAVTVVKMPTLAMCDKAENRSKSKNSMMMNGGDLVFFPGTKEKLRAMFQQSAKASSELAFAEIKKAIQ